VTVRAISYGGGVQSTALLVLAAQGEIDYPVALFANTGDDSEHPATIRYLREVATPYADAHGIELVELQRASDEREPQYRYPDADEHQRRSW
jgi:3'-phosphoadenosine 5'-phosphosulfate sulfotransferase (PAPS reductase)/FAD synthetase